MPKIKTVPQQRVIIVNKADSDKQHFYTILNLDALQEASKILQTKAGIKLYLYFAKNKHQYTTALSSSDFIQWAGVSITAYNTAFKELVEKGYLVKRNESNYYDFYEQRKRDYLNNLIPNKEMNAKQKENKGFVF